MQEMEVQMPRPPEEPEARSGVRPLSVVVLVLVFAAAATSTFAVLSGGSPAPAEVAAAATTSVDPHAFDGISLTAKSAYVIDLTDNRVLYELDAATPRPLASITKVMTTLVATEVLPLDSMITIPFDAASANGAEHLTKGERWDVGDLITFTLVSSSNDGATILAQAADPALAQKYPTVADDGADSVSIWRMNDLARSLGLSSMRFVNPNGLDESTTEAGAYGSARDVAALFAYASTHEPGVFAGTSRDSVALVSPSGAKAVAYNTDKALSTIPGIVMGKTGYTDLAGGNLAIVFDVGPAHPVVAVVLGSTETARFTDMKALVAATQKEISGTTQ